MASPPPARIRTEARVPPPPEGIRFSPSQAASSTVNGGDPAGRPFAGRNLRFLFVFLFSRAFLLLLSRSNMTFPMATSTASTAAADSLRHLPAPATPSSHTIRFPPILCRVIRALLSVSALSKLSEASPIPFLQEPTQTLPDEDALPPRPRVYGVFDPAGDLQFLGISRNVRASIEGHRRKVPADLCASVKVYTSHVTHSVGFQLHHGIGLRRVSYELNHDN
ncbi:Monothiol glutaredoxin-S12, chloroplastic [Hordeum vulgare]|nr:Monothiol glutaredoxin-S12, chloroplastic [Hordeum vulgare]